MPAGAYLMLGGRCGDIAADELSGRVNWPLTMAPLQEVCELWNTLEERHRTRKHESFDNKVSNQNIHVRPIEVVARSDRVHTTRFRHAPCGG